MYEKEMINYMKNLGVQIYNLNTQVLNLERAVKSLRTRGGVVTRVVPLGIKDITSAQLFDAYKKGLDMEQLVILADGKYTPEQIAKKLEKLGGIRYGYES